MRFLLSKDSRNPMIKKLSIFLILIIVSGSQLVFATPTSISMYPENSTYTYGEFLYFDLTVDEIGKNATLYIGDTSGIKTKLTDQFPIDSNKIHYIFPFSIQPENYKVGKYFIFTEYEGLNDSVEFNIVDSDKAVISIPDRTQVMLAVTFTDDENKFFRDLLKYFNNKEYLQISDIIELNSSEKLMYPEYIKQTTTWWIEGRISDNDFIQFLQYTVEKNIIRIHENEQT